MNIRTRNFKNHVYGVNANSYELLCILECCYMEKHLQILLMRQLMKHWLLGMIIIFWFFLIFKNFFSDFFLINFRDKIINHNIRSNMNQWGSSLSFRSWKDLWQTITILSQNFSKSMWNHFYVTYLHNPSMLSTHHHKPIVTLDHDKHDLWPLHFEKKA